MVQLCREQYGKQGENAWLDQPLSVEREAQARIAELEGALERAHLENEMLHCALEE